ncbi:MAG: hypothetical protein R2825_16610 [Saprospiraceae bacterium]
MILTGFTDEATSDLAGQIRITQELGWQYILPGQLALKTSMIFQKKI